MALDEKIEVGRVWTQSKGSIESRTRLTCKFLSSLSSSRHKYPGKLEGRCEQVRDKVPALCWVAFKIILWPSDLFLNVYSWPMAISKLPMFSRKIPILIYGYGMEREWL